MTGDLVEAGERFQIVLSNHVLHHLDGRETGALLADCERLVGPGGIAVLGDIERSRWGYAGFWLGTLPFAGNLLAGTYIRGDGLASIRRSHTAAELAGVLPPGWRVRRAFPSRLEVAWGDRMPEPAAVAPEPDPRRGRRRRRRRWACCSGACSRCAGATWWCSSDAASGRGGRARSASTRPGCAPSRTSGSKPAVRASAAEISADGSSARAGCSAACRSPGRVRCSRCRSSRPSGCSRAGSTSCGRERCGAASRCAHVRDRGTHVVVDARRRRRGRARDRPGLGARPVRGRGRRGAQRPARPARHRLACPRRTRPLRDGRHPRRHRRARPGAAALRARQASWSRSPCRAACDAGSRGCGARRHGRRPSSSRRSCGRARRAYSTPPLPRSPARSRRGSTSPHGSRTAASRSSATPRTRSARSAGRA